MLFTQASLSEKSSQVMNYFSIYKLYFVKFNKRLSFVSNIHNISSQIFTPLTHFYLFVILYLFFVYV